MNHRSHWPLLWVRWEPWEVTGSVHFHRIPLLLRGLSNVGSKSGSRDQLRECCSQLGDREIYEKGSQALLSRIWSENLVWEMEKMKFFIKWDGDDGEGSGLSLKVLGLRCWWDIHWRGWAGCQVYQSSEDKPGLVLHLGTVGTWCWKLQDWMKSSM